MPKVSDKQIRVADQKYACTSCGQCCRRAYVHVTPEDIARLRDLRWPADAGVPADDFTVRINGSDYLAHTAENGDEHCVFLDSATNLCKIHGRFGAEAKPLGCRVYPYNIVSTFPGEYSVIARHDCPAVRDADGPPISRDLRDIRGYMAQMRFRDGYDREVTDGLTKAATNAFLKHLFAEILNHPRLNVPQKMLGCIIAAERAEKLGPDFLNDPELAADEIYPALFLRVRETLIELRPRRLSAVERWRFFALLIAYLRRDEYLVLRGAGDRIKRMLHLAQTFFSKGRPKDLGPDHPQIQLSRDLVFGEAIADIDRIDWRLYMDLTRIRLQSYQFFGATNFDLTFFTGMKAWFLTFPLLIAAAKWHMVARAGKTLEHADLDYGVDVIDHAFGRNAFLSLPIFTILTRQMTEPEPYQRLVAHILEPGVHG